MIFSMEQVEKIFGIISQRSPLAKRIILALKKVVFSEISSFKESNMQKRIILALKKVVFSEILSFPFAEEGDIIKIGDAFWRVIGEAPNSKNLVAYRSDRKGNIFQKKLLLWFMDTKKEKHKRCTKPDYKFKKIGNIPPTADEIPLWDEWRRRRS